MRVGILFSRGTGSAGRKRKLKPSKESTKEHRGKKTKRERRKLICKRGEGNCTHETREGVLWNPLGNVGKGGLLEKKELAAVCGRVGSAGFQNWIGEPGTSVDEKEKNKRQGEKGKRGEVRSIQGHGIR